MYKTKKLCALVMILILIIVVSGCDKEKKIDYVENSNLASDTDGTKGEETEIGTETMSDSLAEQIGAPERWDGEYEGNDAGMTGIDVAADINLDGISGVNAYHAKGIKLTEIYKQNFVETLSEGIIYQYDDESRPKLYWQNLIEEQENYIAQYEERVKNGETEEDSYYMDLLHDSLHEYQEKYDVAPEDYVVAENFNCNEYKITYLGMNYYVYFAQSDEGYVECIGIHMIDAEEIIGDNAENQTVGTAWSGVDINNVGIYTLNDFQYQSEENGYVREPEQIEREIQTFLDGLGIQDFKVIQNCNVEIYIGDIDKRENSWIDGCGAVLYKNVDGTVLCGQEYEYVDDAVDNPYNRDRLERIELSINDVGVFDMDYYFPLEWTKYAESVQILPFENIKEYMLQYARELDSIHPIYTKIDLIYCLYSETKGSHDFMIVPVWRFYNSNGSVDSSRDEIMVNAIDGSRVNIMPY